MAGPPPLDAAATDAMCRLEHMGFYASKFIECDMYFLGKLYSSSVKTVLVFRNITLVGICCCKNFFFNARYFKENVRVGMERNAAA